MTILHIASWYPGPWDNIEGNFVRDQIALFRQECPAEVVVVQVRPQKKGWPRLTRPVLDGGARGYILHATIRPGRVMEWVTSLLLFMVLLRERAWRFKALHFHIAYPLLMHAHQWRWIFRKPMIIISEHWSAYHYKFHLPEGSRALHHMRRPFQLGVPVLAVSGALLDDIRNFARRDDFKGFVIPNVVPLHGASVERRDIPVLFAVNRWVSIKNPMQMLDGLGRAAEAGLEFKLVLGGYGDLMARMKDAVEQSALQSCTHFMGKMTKQEIAMQLAETDGYLFSSDYETFSIACAEALGAGVPLIGPHIPAIAEYAGFEDRIEVKARNPEAWQDAITRFVQAHTGRYWDRDAIAKRAATQFSDFSLRVKYRQAMNELGEGQAQ